MIKAVVFDLDDTLISEREYIESGYHHVSKILSRRLNKDEKELYQLLVELLNVCSKNVFNRLFDRLGVFYTKDTVMEIVEEYRNHLPNIKFFDDVLACLENLKQKGVKLCIITDGYSSAQRQKLNAIKASKYFDEIILTDELGKEFWKPHPMAFELMRKKVQVEYNEMVYVGDNPEKDFYIGKIHPIQTIRIVREKNIYKDREYLKGVREKMLIFNMNELINTIY